MTKYCEEFNCDWLTIQGEIYGKKIQKRDYSLDDIDFAVFNFITPTKTFNPIEIHMMCEDVFFNLPTVPIVNDNYYLPDTVEEVLEFADGMSALDGKVREGIVFRNTDGLSFKAVSNKYLLKYHS